MLYILPISLFVSVFNAAHGMMAMVAEKKKVQSFDDSTPERVKEQRSWLKNAPGALSFSTFAVDIVGRFAPIAGLYANHDIREQNNIFLLSIALPMEVLITTLYRGLSSFWNALSSRNGYVYSSRVSITTLIQYIRRW